MRRASIVAVVTLALVGCKKPEAPQRPAAPAAAQPGAPGDRQILTGKVLEKIDVSQYSYLKLATPSGEVWAAVTRTDKKVGDQVGVGNAFPMQNFESKELNRKFDVVYFGTLAGPGGEAAAMPPAMGGGAMGGGAMGGGMPPPAAEGPPNPAQLAAQHQAVVTGPSDVKVEKIAKAGGADGRTIEEIWTQREKLKGKPVAVRGQVVKATAVMGKNFLHLRDGSGSADRKTNDLTVTTADAVGVGDVVTAKGLVTTDKDFGAGYAYPVILEDAKVNK